MEGAGYGDCCLLRGFLTSYPAHYSSQSVQPSRGRSEDQHQHRHPDNDSENIVGRQRNFRCFKGNYDSTPQKHLLRGRCIHMYMEHKNHPDLRQTCRYEARKCQVSRNHHQSWRTESFSPFLRMWVRDGRSSPLLLQFGDQSWWGLTFFALLCFFSCF